MYTPLYIHTYIHILYIYILLTSGSRPCLALQMPSATMTYANHLDCDAKAANARGNEREEAPGRRRGHPKAAGAREADRDKGKGAGCHDPSATGTGERERES